MNLLIDLNDCFYRFQHECKIRGIIAEKNHYDFTIKIFYINGKQCKYYESSKLNGKNYVFTIKKSSDKNYNIDIPYFFVFRIRNYPDFFWIIPREILIENSIIASGNNSGSKELHIPPPGQTNKGKPWLNNYLNNYLVLK